MELERHMYNIGVADYETHGMSREDEDIHLKNAFYNIRKLGDYDHIHTLRIIPDDGREPYFIYDTEKDTE